MPALDQYQPQFINALRKAGWQVSGKPYLIRLDERDLFADIQAEYTSEDSDKRIIIVEIKGFEGASAIRSLEEAIGQYVVYRALLEELGVILPLYLAVPIPAYDGILSEKVGQTVRKRLKIRIIVFDVENEEIVQWLD